MKRLILLLITLVMVITANADTNVVIHNNNQDDGYSMAVTYRLCHPNSNGIISNCDDLMNIILAKNGDFKVKVDGIIFIYSASLVNDITRAKTAETQYLTLPFTSTIESTMCFFDIRKIPGITVLEDKLTLDDMHSPYIVCQKHTKSWS